MENTEYKLQYAEWKIKTEEESMRNTDYSLKKKAETQTKQDRNKEYRTTLPPMEIEV